MTSSIEAEATAPPGGDAAPDWAPITQIGGIQRLIRRSGVYVVAAALNAIGPFLIMPILTRVLGPAGYGVVGTFTAMVNIAAVLVGLSCHGVVSVKYFRTDRRSFPETVGSCLLIALCGAAGLAVVSLPLAPYIGRATGVVAPWQLAVVLSATGQFLLLLSLAVWQAQGRAVRYGSFQVGNTFIGLLLSVALVVVAHWGWRGRAFGQASIVMVAAVIAIASLYREKLLSLRVSRTEIRDALGFGVPLVPHMLAGVAMASIDRIVLAATRDSQSAGLYFAAFQVAAPITLFGAAVNQAMIPWLYAQLANPTPDNRKRVVRVTYAIYGLLATAAVGLVVVGPLLLRLFAGNRFAGAGHLLPILAVAAAFNGAYYSVTNYLFFANRTGVLSVVTSCVAIVQALLTVALVHRWDLTGAAVATLTAAALHFILLWAAAHRCIPMPWFRGRTPNPIEAPE